VSSGYLPIYHHEVKNAVGKIFVTAGGDFEKNDSRLIRLCVNDFISGSSRENRFSKDKILPFLQEI